MEDFLKQNIKKAENMDKYIKITGVFFCITGCYEQS